MEDAQNAVGNAMLSALGPLADILRLRPKKGAKSMATGQPARWAAAREALVASKLKSVTPAQAAELAAAGALGGAAPLLRYSHVRAVSSLAGLARAALQPRSRVQHKG